MAEYLKPLLCLVLTLAAVYGCMAVDYAVSNNAGSSIGGKLFDKQVGADYAMQTLGSATDFTPRLFQQNNVADRKINVVVENIDGVAHCSNNEIHTSATYVDRYPGDVKKEITGILHHEMAHVWQWDGNGQAPLGLTEGRLVSAEAW
ncbi:basic secretory protein [Spatholobus suberectus]|nr:basic secretory protein [Spatholobus suberectus]